MELPEMSRFDSCCTCMVIVVAKSIESCGVQQHWIFQSPADMQLEKFESTICFAIVQQLSCVLVYVFLFLELLCKLWFLLMCVVACVCIKQFAFYKSKVYLREKKTVGLV